MHSDLYNTIQLYYSRERLISPGVCKQVLSFLGSIMNSGKKDVGHEMGERQEWRTPLKAVLDVCFLGFTINKLCSACVLWIICSPVLEWSRGVENDCLLICLPPMGRWLARRKLSTLECINSLGLIQWFWSLASSLPLSLAGWRSEDWREWRRQLKIHKRAENCGPLAGGSSKYGRCASREGVSSSKQLGPTAKHGICK